MENNSTQLATNFGEAEQESKGNIGPLVGVLVIIAILIAGGLYFFGGSDIPADGAASQSSSNEGNAEADALLEQGTSDNINEVSADFEATSFSELNFDEEEFDETSTPQ